MAVHASHAAVPYPIYNTRFSFGVPGLDADGDPTDPTTPDSEVSVDNGTWADCTEEVVTPSGSNGVSLMTLTGAEMKNSTIWYTQKVASGPKAPILTIYPRRLATIGSGTLSAGSAGGGTLGTLLPYDVTGCFIRTTGGTGGGGSNGTSNQARKIDTYNTSTGAFTVTPNWETTPDNTTTYDVLLPEGVTLGMLRTLNPTTAGDTITLTTNRVDVGKWIGTAVTLSGGLPDVNMKTITAGIIAAASFAANALDAVWSTATRALTDKAGFALSSAGNLAIWDVQTSTTTAAGSIGKWIIDKLDVLVSTRATPAQVNTEVVDVMTVDANAEPVAPPAATAALDRKVAWLFALARNKRLTTATQDKVRDDADGADIGTSALSDDGTTFTRGKYA